MPVKVVVDAMVVRWQPVVYELGKTAGGDTEVVGHGGGGGGDTTARAKRVGERDGGAAVIASSIPKNMLVESGLSRQREASDGGNEVLLGFLTVVLGGVPVERYVSTLEGHTLDDTSRRPPMQWSHRLEETF